MEIIVKTRFNCATEKFEKFGGNFYMLYLTFEKDKDAETVIKQYLSRKMGAPVDRIKFKRINNFMSKGSEDWIFEIL